MTYTFELCKGRHQTPCSEAIFGTEVDPLDFQGMYDTAMERIPSDATKIDLYITGLTPATLAVVKVCMARKISLTCHHYDRDSGEYVAQDICTWFDSICPECGRHTRNYRV